MVNNKTPEGLIFNIQRFSVHDGPGIRDLVFMKGCPLRCLWCDNPESQNGHPELMFNPGRCIKCGRCVEVCPTGAIKELKEGEIEIRRDRCNNCGNCAEICPAKALKIIGETVAVDRLLRIAEQDSPFYWRSGVESLWVVGSRCLRLILFMNY
ncbi:4Fe-4S binding protein [Chloroflexota bacterium]